MTQTVEQQRQEQRAVGIANILKDICTKSLIPTDFANAMFACGFSPDWDLRENELATVRIAIKRNLGFFGKLTSEMESKIQYILTTLCNVYQRYLHD